MTTAMPYANGASLWRAVNDRIIAAVDAEQEPGSRSARIQARQREFVFGRFLARVFAEDSSRASEWVLKGGTAMLLRVHDARATKDLDLLHELGDLDAAVRALDLAAARDLGDYFRFRREGIRYAGTAPTQPAVAGARVTFEVSCGTKRLGRLGVDLVTGSLMTAAPDLVPTTNVAVLPLPGQA